MEAWSGIPFIQEVLQISLFLIGTAVFVFVSARFSTGITSVRKAMITTLVLAGSAAFLLVLKLPDLLSVLSLLVIAVITIQTVYQVELKDVVVMIIIYLTISTIAVTATQGLASLI